MEAATVGHASAAVRHRASAMELAAVGTASLEAAATKTLAAAIIPPTAIITGAAIKTATVEPFIIIVAIIVITIPRPGHRAPDDARDCAADNRSRDIVAAKLDLPNLRCGMDPLRSD